MSKFDKEYLKLCRKILNDGTETSNRTGTNTIKIPAYTFSFDLSEEFPILTTKKVFIRQAVLEMMWIYLVASNDVKWLQERNVSIWDEWKIDDDGIYRVYSNEEVNIESKDREVPVYYDTGKLDDNGHDVLENMYVSNEGKIYRENKKTKDCKVLMAKSICEGKVIKSARYFGKSYAGTIGHAYGHTVKKYDLLNRCLTLIKACKKDPSISDGRRNIMNLWQEDEIKDSVLKPCVYCSEWDVTDGKLNVLVHQRSCDVPLGLPFNVTQYATLLLILARVTGLEPGIMEWSIKDAQIYVNQVKGIKEQLRRMDEEGDYPAPKVWINPQCKNISDFDLSRECKDIKLENYVSHPKIEFDVSV